MPPELPATFEPSPPPEPSAEPAALPPFRPSRRFERRSAGPPRRPIPGERTLGYVTVPERGRAGELELRAQAERIHKVCRELKLSLLRLVVDVEEEAHSPMDRPGVAQLFDRLAAGEATCVVVTELKRLAASADDWRLLRDSVDTRVVRLVAIDVALDTTAEPEVWTGAGSPPGPLH